MLESLVAWVLNNYVGDYLENLNNDQLSIALLSGQVELENVPLKKTALRKLDLPLTVRSGVLGKLTLSVPVTRVRSEAWTLRMSDVLVLLGPEEKGKYDAEVEEAAELARKQALLDELQRLHQNELCSAMGIVMRTGEENSWWGASLLSTVLNNIQLIVSNVHIRYEDSSSLSGGRSFCSGVRIQNVIVQTTNNRWKPGFVEPQDGVNIFKKLELRGFSFYWNSGQEPSVDINTVRDVQTLLSPENTGGNSYVISPCCGELRMEKNSSKLPLKEKTPRFKFLLRTETILVELSRSQRREMRSLSREWARFERARPHRKWRPAHSIHEDVRGWWRFACVRVVAECRLDCSRRTWAAVLTRARHLNVYARAYRRRLLQLVLDPASRDTASAAETEKAEAKASSEDKTVMRQIERDSQYSFNELSIIRDVVFSRLLRENGVEGNLPSQDDFENIASEEVDSVPEAVPATDGSTVAGGGLLSWMTSFFSSAVDETEAEEKKNEFGPIDLGELRSNLPKELRDIEKQVDKEILDVLHDSWDDSTLLRKDFLLAESSMRIDHITLRLTDSAGSGSSRDRVLVLDLIGVASHVEVSPRTHSLTISLSVHEMNAQSLQLAPTSPGGEEEEVESSLLYSPEDSTRVLFALGRSTEAEKADAAPFFRLFYRRQSVRATRHTLEASLRPLSAVYEQNALAGLWSIFSDSEEERLGELTEESASTRETSVRSPSHLFASISVPSVKLELRRPGAGLVSSEGADSCAVASLTFQRVLFTLNSTQLDLTQARVRVGHVELEDDFEGTSYPLFATRGDSSLVQCPSSLSSSWPHLHMPSTSMSTASVLSSSLPTDSPLEAIRWMAEDQRKTSSIVSSSINGENGEELLLLFSLVGSDHPLFESKYDKSNCVVEATVKNVETGISRRTWTVLMDMAGLLGEEEGKEKEALQEKQLAVSPFVVSCSLRVSSLALNMEFPAGGYRLGTLLCKDLLLLTKVGVGDAAESLSVDASMASLAITDRSPVHSVLYDTRLLLRGDPSSRAHLRLTKYAEGHREACDMRVEMESGPGMRLLYVHTHRYLCALIDFWQQFAELHDYVSRSKKATVCEGARSRIALDIRLRSPTEIVLPRNFDSDEVLLMRTEGVEMGNTFERASQLADILDDFCLERDSQDDNIDCLLDNASCTLLGLRLHEGRRISRENKIRSPHLLDCSTFCVLAEPADIFDKPFDLSVNILRNLSSERSHALPDLSILYCVRDVHWRMSSHFFVLLRGFLEMNLGEPLIPAPETIPHEILHKPILSCEVGSDKKYSTLSVRVSFDGVVVECCVSPSCSLSASPSSFSLSASPLAALHLNEARLSFDVSIDGQAELDLICERAELHDSRESGGSRSSYGPVLAPLPGTQSKLLGEAHVMLRKDEAPVLTVVLMHARILVLPDFLNDVKDFILLSPHPPPPAEEAAPPLTARTLSAGVISRTASAPTAPPPTPPNTIKVTMRNSDLVFAERPREDASLALIARTTTVLQMTESGGNINAHLEIQDMSLSWCLLSWAETRSVFSNNFSSCVSLVMARDLSPNRGLPLLLQPRVMLDVELSGLICKLSHHDIGALRDIAAGYSLYISTQQISVFTKPADPGIALGRISLKWENADIWLQDEINGTTLPLVRLSLYNVSLDREGERMKASLTLSADYFSQRLFGWEPLIERWNVLRLLSAKNDRGTNIELVAGAGSTLDINVTEQLIAQALAFQQRWPAIQEAFNEAHYRRGGSGATQHVAYVLKNSTEASLLFTTAVEEHSTARSEQRRSTARWHSLGPAASLHFEFPTILLFYSQAEREPPRQLIVRVKGWDECTPVNVDACGTYFRVIKAHGEKLRRERIVIRVSMERDGRKQIEVSSSVRVINHLAHPVQLLEAESKRKVCRVDGGGRATVPLADAASSFSVEPCLSESLSSSARLVCSLVTCPGQSLDSTVCLQKPGKGVLGYWLCTSIRREQYPEQDNLPGHTILLLSPLSVRSLLPVDAQLTIGQQTHVLRAGKKIQLTSVDIGEEVRIILETERLRTGIPLLLSRSTLSAGEDSLLSMRLLDERDRPVILYVNARRTLGGTVDISFWTPFWIVNKSGLPLIIRQEAAEDEAAGQAEEHERATDRHPLMFDFVDDRCPKQCTVRLGSGIVKDGGYRPLFARRIHLSPGVQALKLQLVHQDSLPTIYYNVGVEVRPGTGLYKDTQVVLLTSRYILNNASSHVIYASHHDLLDQPARHVAVASQCSLVWHENYEEASWICLRRADATHWSCPFRIDQVRSCHVTMRASDESPVFIRMEVTLHGAVFHVTLTDAYFYPPPIQIDNQSEVPVLYQQLCDNPARPYIRTICKAKSKADYAWDDPSGARLLVLQVYEKKSHAYDPSRPGAGPPLIYENAFFISLLHSFQNVHNSMRTENCELVLEVLQKGKVVLNKQNRVDGNSGSQLWRWTAEGCLESVGMAMRVRSPLVLDCIDGGRLMMTSREGSRDRSQRWRLRGDGRMQCQVQGMAVTARAASLEVVLAKEEEGCREQLFGIEKQRPGSGTLDVHCMHSGPTLMVRITDREDGVPPEERPSLSSLSAPASPSLEVTVHLRSGLGFSLVSSSHEELLYGRLTGVEVFARMAGVTCQLTASIHDIQVDNQLLYAEHWAVMSCRAEQLVAGVQGEGIGLRPALKLEMHCVPRKHYDSFDVLRVRLCPLTVHLDELLLWKVLSLLHSSHSSRHADFLLSPPNTNLTRPDPSNSRRCYFGTLDLQLGNAALSVVTTSKNALPLELRQLKEQYNVKLVSFEGASIDLPAFRQFHYFETSSFLLESLRKFYMAELRKQTVNIIMTLDAFGNPQGLATDLKDSFQGLFIEMDVQRFVTGLGYGFSNSVSKIASSMSSGVGSLTFDHEHEQKRKKTAGPAPSALSHLYGGVKGLGVGVIGGMTAIITNTIHESKKNGIVTGTLRGLTTGALDTVTKPVQGICDFVEGTASALKHATGPAGGRGGQGRMRQPRLCKGLYGLLPPFNADMAKAQQELMRINGHKTNETLLEVEVLAEQLPAGRSAIRTYILLSCSQAYICREEGGVQSVLHRIPYAFLKTIAVNGEMPNSLTSIEVILEGEEGERMLHLWCTRAETARRVVEKMQRAKHDYDHAKRSIQDAADEADDAVIAEGGCPV